MADWLAIEGAYRAGIKSVREIADEYGSASSTIQHRAKKNGWIRDAAGTKRQIVRAGMSGVAQGVAQVTMCQVAEAAAQDIEDMNTGLSSCRKVLRAMDTQADSNPLLPSMAKTIMEAVEKAIGTIRTIRELNAPGLNSAGSNGPILIQVVAVGAQNNEA